MRERPDFARYYALVTAEKREKFEQFREILLEYNAKFNLTSVTDEREILYKHFLDSVAGEGMIPVGASVCEVGSGAGFPSIPLKIIRDDLSFTLIESTEKKCRFLETAIGKLGLIHMRVVQIRAEDAGRMPEFREKYDVTVARAVARLNTLAEYCLPLVKKGGRFLAWKGCADGELSEAAKAISVLGGTETATVEYDLPEGFGKRTLVAVGKGKNTPAKYPRGRGRERSEPIG